MSLKLVLPRFDRSVEGGTILRWHVREGDAVGFGENLFDLWVSERVHLMRAQRVDDVLGRRNATPTYNRTRADMCFRVVSADAAVVRQIKVPSNEDLRVGDVAAVLDFDRSEAVEGQADELAEMPEMRVSVSLLEEDADL